MKKQLHTEIYNGVGITIDAEYRSDVYSWNIGDTDIVILYYKYSKIDGEPLLLEGGDQVTVEKPLPKRILFWTIKPKKTFYELVEEELADTISHMKYQIDKCHKELKVTSGLIGSLKGLS